MSVVNAVLTEVRAHAGVNAYGKVAEGDDGDLRWSGTRTAYLTRVKKSVKRGEIRETIWVDMLYVRGTLPIELTPGAQAEADTVVIHDNRPPAAIKRFRVVGVEVKAAGTPVDSVAIELADPRVTA